MKKTNRIFAVITGDIIGSSRLSSKQKEDIKYEIETLLSNEEGIVLPAKFYRGDSFQMMVTPEKALFITLLIEILLLSKVSTMARISVGIGEVSKINQDDVLQSEGEAFILSGRNFDQLKKTGREMIIFIDDPVLQGALDITLMMGNSLIRNFKPAQASVAVYKLKGLKQNEIAQQLTISEAAVSKTVKSINWTTIEAYLGWYQKTIKSFLQ